MLNSRQFEQVKALLHRLEKNSGFYKIKFNETGFKADDFQNPEDFEKLPF
ncbi:MAG TPA: phenylacetate--CoA ligase, partial [Ruminococcaceae bacterium]|nr:phenylacetate--CoA ligase [Oscillospiraceae bacterium]